MRMRGSDSFWVDFDELGWDDASDSESKRWIGAGWLMLIYD